MWLVNVETFELEDFLSDTKPPYAILSHTWGDRETTFSKFTSSVGVAKIDAKIFNTCRMDSNTHGLTHVALTNVAVPN